VTDENVFWLTILSRKLEEIVCNDIRSLHQCTIVDQSIKALCIQLVTHTNLFLMSVESQTTAVNN